MIFFCSLSYDIAHEPLSDLENGASTAIYFYFKDLVVETQTEYLVCDYSCLIGEIGGNLGFFLGGSVLAVIDLLVSRWA